MATVKIVTSPVREGGTCKVEVTGDGLVQVTVTINGVVVGRYIVQPPATVEVKVPIDTAGKTLRVSTADDFDSTFILG